VRRRGAVAVAAPIVLIGAGAIGLVGLVVNARNARARTAADVTTIDLDENGSDTLVIDKEQQA
jgi:hypothetical protein